jgi:hypothetical protein
MQNDVQAMLTERIAIREEKVGQPTLFGISLNMLSGSSTSIAQDFGGDNTYGKPSVYLDRIASRRASGDEFQKQTSGKVCVLGICGPCIAHYLKGYRSEGSLTARFRVLSP